MFGVKQIYVLVRIDIIDCATKAALVNVFICPRTKVSDARVARCLFFRLYFCLFFGVGAFLFPRGLVLVDVGFDTGIYFLCTLLLAFRMVDVKRIHEFVNYESTQIVHIATNIGNLLIICPRTKFSIKFSGARLAHFRCFFGGALCCPIVFMFLDVGIDIILNSLFTFLVYVAALVAFVELTQQIFAICFQQLVDTFAIFFDRVLCKRVQSVGTCLAIVFFTFLNLLIKDAFSIGFIFRMCVATGAILVSIIKLIFYAGVLNVVVTTIYSFIYVRGEMIDTRIARILIFFFAHLACCFKSCLKHV